ncbi:hypothetical protein CFAM422_009235 [Trichoderma lentiforme]|uniref:Uncharacterized protein n=1 Tax=Trichoderma lentiforme TaxID=1567552 RepID=A0A9P5CBL5_9HYPO|nr:hypothetical protein CFAM422_009235 [Trichoderma lentiforme]
MLIQNNKYSLYLSNQQIQQQKTSHVMASLVRIWPRADSAASEAPANSMAERIAGSTGSRHPNIIWPRLLGGI